MAAHIEHFDGSPTTKYGYTVLARRIPEELTRLRLRQVTPQKLDSYYRKLRKDGLSNGGCDCSPGS